MRRRPFNHDQLPLTYWARMSHGSCIVATNPRLYYVHTLLMARNLASLWTFGGHKKDAVMGEFKGSARVLRQGELDFALR